MEMSVLDALCRWDDRVLTLGIVSGGNKLVVATIVSHSIIVSFVRWLTPRYQFILAAAQLGRTLHPKLTFPR